MKEDYHFLKSSEINIGGTHVFGKLYGVRSNYLTNKIIKKI